VNPAYADDWAGSRRQQIANRPHPHANVLCLILQHSHWDAYLNLVPNNSNLVPMLWSENEYGRLLEGTGVARWVASDKERMREDHQSLLQPFMKNNPDLFQ